MNEALYQTLQTPSPVRFIVKNNTLRIDIVYNVLIYDGTATVKAQFTVY